jgi:serine/threonine protein phosphatase PrpC
MENSITNHKSLKELIINLSHKKVQELREICRQYNIKIPNKYIQKKYLINLILDSRKKIKNSNKIVYIKNPEGGSVYAIQGRRESMEDTHVISKMGEARLYGVFDGHGGDEVSKSLPQMLTNNLLPQINSSNYKNEDLIKKLILKVFLEIDNELHRLNLESGSTAVLVLTIFDYLYIINLGDSRGILYYYERAKNGAKKGKLIAQFITRDHKPDDIQEKKLVENNKGTVEYDEEDDSYRVNGYLAMSRAFGDFDLKYKDTKMLNKGPVSIIPDITVFKCDKKKKYYIVLASDGLWDVVSNQRCLGFLDQFGTQTGCKFLVKEAYDKESWDNICVLTANIN